MATKELADFLYDIQYDRLPQRAVEQAKMCIVDLLGAAAQGSNKPVGLLWKRYFAEQPGGSDATVWEKGWPKASAEHAAALNAAYGHIIDMDDVHNSSITHLGAVTIPAALAVAQQVGASGKQLIEAIVAGYEIGARVGEAVNPVAYHYWHTTAVVGGLCSAVAAGKLLGLTAEQLLHAIGSAGTQAAGLWEFLVDGAMSKTLHTANATLCGIRAAKLAALGFTGAQDVLAGGRGLIGALALGAGRPEALAADLSYGNLKILSNSFKPYACCRHTHSANYAVELLQQQHRIPPEDIAKIVDSTYQIAQSTVDCANPATSYGYKFSVQYCIAAMFAYGSLTDEIFTPEKIESPQVRRIMDTVRVRVDERLEELYQQDRNRWPHRLEVTLKDGRVLREEAVYPYGDFNNPFDWAYAHKKFFALTGEVWEHLQAEALLKRIATLEELSDINLLFTENPNV